MKANVRRSLLYVPGDSEKMLQKSVAFAADVLLLNLEDGVAASRKAAARENIAAALPHVQSGHHEVVVRVNPPDTEPGALDLAAVVPMRPDGICVPKIEQASQIGSLERILAGIEAQAGIPIGSTQIHAMIESASGVLHALEIASASPRMASLVFGSADYVADVGCRPGPDRMEMLLTLQMLVMAARAAGIAAIDAPCFDLCNPDLLCRETEQARRMGFDGKSALHPNQLDCIHRIFDPTAEEIAWAKQTIVALDAAENQGKALTTMDGKLLDNPHRLAAERILRRSGTAPA